MFRVGDRGVLRASAWDRHPWLIHGFSTRATGDFLDWPDDAEIAAAFGASGFGTATLRQVHAARLVRADSPWGSTRPEADAVMTARAGVLVGVRTADCFPILLADPVTRTVAAVHAGWRGTVAGVLPNAVARLTAAFGARHENLEAVIGPGIGTCCFEVGNEVAGEFRPDFVRRGRGRPHVDLAAALKDQLARSGVLSIRSCGHCTSCNLDRYFSHRREHGVTGRMLSLVGIESGAGE